MPGPAHLRRLIPSGLYPNVDPYEQPQTSFRNKVGRLLWSFVYRLLFRPSLRPMHTWRAFLLRCFGAKIGPKSRIHAGAEIWAPWNLICEDLVVVADGAVLYNAAEIRLGSHAVVSQQAFLCTGTHDFDDPEFPMIVAPITLGSYAWVCARACVLPGVTMGDGAVLGLGSIGTRNMEAWQVYAGHPAQRVKARKRFR